MHGLLKGCAVTTRANRKEQVDALKKAQGLNHIRDADVAYERKKSNSESPSPSKTQIKDLLDRYLSKGSPDKLMMEALKELNINDICDFLKKEEPPDLKQFEKKRAPPPQYHLESSRGDGKDQLTSFQLQPYFGGCHLKDFGLLSKLETGLAVIDNDQDIPSIGESVNRKQGKRRRKGSKGTAPLEVVGMDIGSGDGASIGGCKYVLVLANQCTSNSFIYGMQGSSGANICEALWKFFIDAGGFPKILQCNFNTRLIGGKAAALLRSYDTRIMAAPPYRQYKNGLVERCWQSLTKMACSFLTEAKLPKKCWYYAIREANLRMNILPITQQKDGIDNPALMSTHFEYFGVKPD